MTPTDLLTAARQAYNAVGDSFFSDLELYNLIWRAQDKLARETLCLRGTATTTTANGTREYTIPTTAIAIKRVTYNGRKLEPIDFDDDDVLTGYSEATTETGTPLYYLTWGTSIFLRPTPNSATTLKIWYYKKASQVSTLSTLDIPEEYQLMLIDFILHHMVSKDGDKPNLAAYHLQNWNQSVKEIMEFEKRKLRKDRAEAVKNLDAYSEVIGIR